MRPNGHQASAVDRPGEVRENVDPDPCDRIDELNHELRHTRPGDVIVRDEEVSADAGLDGLDRARDEVEVGSMATCAPSAKPLHSDIDRDAACDRHIRRAKVGAKTIERRLDHETIDSSQILFPRLR